MITKEKLKEIIKLRKKSDKLREKADEMYHTVERFCDELQDQFEDIIVKHLTSKDYNDIFFDFDDEIVRIEYDDDKNKMRFIYIPFDKFVEALNMEDGKMRAEFIKKFERGIDDDFVRCD